jgi:hypothetical protein
LKGSVLGEFHVIRQIGHGGMGVVFEAEQMPLARRVAVKILPFAALLSERLLRRFHTEAMAVAQLQHPHIVPIYTVGCERGIHYYAMQLIDGPSLAGVIDQLRARRVSQVKPAGGDQPDAAETVVDAAANALTRDAEGAEHYRAVARVGREAAEAPHRLESTVPRPLSLIINQALTRRPADRYQSAKELADTLQRFLSGERVQARPEAWLRRTSQRLRRHRLASAVVIGILAVALVATVLTHHLFQGIPADSPAKGDDMKSSTAAKIATAVAAVSILASEAAPDAQARTKKISYAIIDLGAFPSNTPYSDPDSINAQGQVVGWSY